MEGVLVESMKMENDAYRNERFETTTLSVPLLCYSEMTVTTVDRLRPKENLNFICNGRNLKYSFENEVACLLWQAFRTVHCTLH